jgi:predicted acylesterase/phospholipase RssA
LFDKVVFAGGGHRCWWQAGFWEQLSGEIELHPRVIGGVSAGAATACLLYANDARRALAWYERELKGRRSNVNWFNLVRPGERLMPHAAIYRKALRALLGGENFRQLMWRAPEIRVQYSRLPPGMGPKRALLRGMLAYNVEKFWRGSLHPTFGQRLGFTHEVKRVQDCRSERELVDLLVASSSTPPFTPVEMIDGLPCLDGGLVDNVPIGVVADVPGQTLVLTTRRYKAFAPVFARNGLVYVQPSEKVAASSWDYTSPAKYQKTYDLGRRDAEAFLKTFALGRHQDAGSGAMADVSGRETVAAGGSDSAGASPVETMSFGPTLGGTIREGSSEEGATSGGAIRNGALRDYPLRDGPLQDGTLLDGPLQDGTLQDGPVQDGTLRDGSLQDGAFQEGAESAGSRTRDGAIPAGSPAAGQAVTVAATIPLSALPFGTTSVSAIAGGYAPMRATDGADADGAGDADREAEPMSSLEGAEGDDADADAEVQGRARARAKVAARGEDGAGRLDVNARLADYREPTDAGIAEDLSASQPAASDGQARSGRSLRASKI